MTDDLKERLRAEAADATDWNGEIMKQWDKIRQLCAKQDGSDLPRLMFEGLVEGLAEHMNEAVTRIEALEASETHWKERCRAASAEVEKLESHLAMAKKALYEADRDQDHER